MQLPEWSTVVAAVVAFFTGATWLGRLNQRVNKTEQEIEHNQTVNDAAFIALNTKMDEHTKTSAEQWGQVQRALGRIEGKLNNGGGKSGA